MVSICRESGSDPKTLKPLLLIKLAGLLKELEPVDLTFKASKSSLQSHLTSRVAHGEDDRRRRIQRRRMNLTHLMNA